MMCRKSAGGSPEYKEEKCDVLVDDGVMFDTSCNRDLIVSSGNVLVSAAIAENEVSKRRRPRGAGGGGGGDDGGGG